MAKEAEWTWTLDPSSADPKKLPGMIRGVKKLMAKSAKKLPGNIDARRLQTALVEELSQGGGYAYDIVHRVLKKDFGFDNPSDEVMKFGSCVLLLETFVAIQQRMMN